MVEQAQSNPRGGGRGGALWVGVPFTAATPVSQGCQQHRVLGGGGREARGGLALGVNARVRVGVEEGVEESGTSVERRLGAVRGG